MSAIEKLNDRAKQCLAKKVDIPMSPLYHMGLAHYEKSQTRLKLIQDVIDYLTCKAKAKLSFTEDEKEFLVELFEAMSWGGWWLGYKEAARLADWYVNGQGNPKTRPLLIVPDIYRESKIVKATMHAMKKFIVEQRKNNHYWQDIICNDARFMNKPYAKTLRRMNYITEGKMIANGALEAAQNNQRLHKTDGHFYLQAKTTLLRRNLLRTGWQIDSLYDFESFENANYYTEIPLGGHYLIIPDGLSHYMTTLKIAKKFWYRAIWYEKWDETKI